jgi:O-antigen biosynthesis protein
MENSTNAPRVQDIPGLVAESSRKVARRFAELRLAQERTRAILARANPTLRQIEGDVDKVKRGVADVYASRIWRTLVSGGALIQAFKHKPATNPNPDSGSSNHNPSLPPAPAVIANFDYPPSGTILSAVPLQRLDGWAIATVPIQRVELLIDGQPALVPVHYGRKRTDVQTVHPEFPNSALSGFICDFPTSRLAQGSHQFTLRVHTLGGSYSDSSIQVQIDHRPPYEIWLGIQDAVENRGEFQNKTRRLAYQPTISIITPVYRTPMPFLEACVRSVREQTYAQWELCIADDASGDPALRDYLYRLAESDSRIRIRVMERNGGISAASNAALEMATGEFVAFLDHDDELSRDALFHVVHSLNEKPDLDVLYCDEDKLNSEGRRVDGFFKPEWSPDLFLSFNYICHFLVVRHSLLEKVGGLRSEFDGSQDYDLLLRVIGHTDRIHRIPRVLYHWRIHQGSTALDEGQKAGSSNAGMRALQDYVARTGIQADVLEVGATRYRVRYRLNGSPEVAIIIPTAANPKLRTAVKSVLEKTTYSNYRIVLVDNSRQAGAVKKLIQDLDRRGHLIDAVNCRGLSFNFSYLCNLGAQQCDSPYLLFLNDDTSVITPDWIEAMLEHAQKPRVGAVGSLLLFPDDRIQHAGVLLGVYGLAGHAFRLLDSRQKHYVGLPTAIRNCSAVTGACMMMRRDVFEQVGRFDQENLPTCFQDVDLCLKVVERGYRIVYTPYAKLYHYESDTKSSVAELREIEYMKERWRHFIADDPYYSPNLTRCGEAYTPRIEPV